MSDIPKSKEERIEWLKDPNNRDNFVRRGAGAVYWQGDLSDIDSVKIIVSTRSQKLGGGLAHFGGLGEDEDIVEGDILATGINNALREAKEEMEELLGYQPELKRENYKFLFQARDDKFIINNGKGFAVDARIHMYEVDDELWQAIFPNNSNISTRHEDHKGFEETEKAEVLKFKEALGMQDEYHYPHEYFSLWVIAAREMNLDIINLAIEINKDIHPKRISFQKIANDMFIDLAELENFLGDKYTGKLQKYEDTYNRNRKRNKPNNNMNK